MRLLAIESSGSQFSIALFENEACIGQAAHPSRKTSESGTGCSAQLSPTIGSLLSGRSWKPQDLDGIAISKGPGSFTGLRVGIATAMTLAYSLKKPLVGINTHAVLAGQAADSRYRNRKDGSDCRVDSVIRVVTNAQRKQLFCSNFGGSHSSNIRQIGELEILDRDEWLDSIAPGDLITGSGLKPIICSLDASDVEFEVSAETCWEPNAKMVGELAVPRLAKGDFDDLWQLKPLYFRPSSAEEKMAQDNKKPQN